MAIPFTNAMAISKTDYYFRLHQAAKSIIEYQSVYAAHIVTMIFDFYHAEVPVEEAEKYIKNFATKVKKALEEQQ